MHKTTINICDSAYDSTECGCLPTGYKLLGRDEKRNLDSHLESLTTILLPKLHAESCIFLVISCSA